MERRGPPATSRTSPSRSKALMATSVYDGFQEYLARLAPSDAEVEKRKSHKKTIEQALAAEFGAFNELLVMGSHTRDSA
ncbi:MAG: hypothetical protein H0V17_11045, partial [Deltaproteobacteria bacterium]|nr:hypothetical protein [Deltaproteobacteria bacterium]